MLQPFDKLRGCKLAASDGEIGEVSEFYFDDGQWTVRYLVVTTGSWLKGRHVLIAPGALGEFDAQSGTLAVNLTQEQVRNSPPLDSDKPVSRQHESELHRHYGWDPHWVVPGAAGLGAYAPAVFAQQQALADPPPPERAEPEGDPHLRSSSELVNRYGFHAQDGEIGVVDDFVVDDKAWQVRYLVARTSAWFFGTKVLLSPEWIERISFEQWQVFVNLPRSAIKDAPVFDSEAPISRTYEQRLHDHYGRKTYWDAVEAERK
jgi:hypothetical protein